MAKYPRITQIDAWECSDGAIKHTINEAQRHECEVGLLALCNSVFGKDGSGHYGSLNGEDVCRGLLEHAPLFAKHLL